MQSTTAPDLIHLRSAGTSAVIEQSGTALPRIVHWGDDLGELTDADLAALATAHRPQPVSSSVDEPAPVGILPEPSRGWMGMPGLAGHRDGTAFSALFAVDAVTVDPGNEATSARVTVAAGDRLVGIALSLEIELTPSGVLRQRATVRNIGDGRFAVDGVVLTLPVPTRATELLDMTGRHLRERSPQRAPFTVGTHLRDSRRGRTGLDASLVLVAGEAGFGFRSGDVWGIHLGWSGNHRMLAERTNGAESVLGAGELLLPGEVRLAAGDEYTTPWMYGAHGHGLDELAHRFHEYLRARPTHPRSPRPVTMNTWEAVYFDHDLDRLRTLADLAADVGVERFVLDDGWFRHRRNDHAGLGDWYVDEVIWPDGLHPLVDHVIKREMQFGLWVEPEMVNPDSDVAREHPDWIMSADGRMPPSARHQQALDLADADAYAYILERLDSILTEYRIEYLKWDHNRDLIDAGHGPLRGAGVHVQTLAAYRLMDELRARHPGLEIESCSSGGGRVDLGVLQRADRIWTSDCIDALERQQIQRWTGLLVPPELMGAHVGAASSHTTGRHHEIGFRAGTALFGHFGIEWDLSAASPADRAELAGWIALHKDLRSLLHTGTVVRGDHPDPAMWIHGVVARDRSRAIYALVQTATSVQAPTGPVRLPGLDPQDRYRCTPLLPSDSRTADHGHPSWWTAGTVLPGRVIGEVGLQAPTLRPERLVLIEARRLGATDAAG